MKLSSFNLLLAFTAATITATAQTTVPGKQSDSASELAVAKKDLGEMLKRYTEKHPAVIKQRQKIKALEIAGAETRN